MKEYYIIYIDGKKKNTLDTYQDALRFIRDNYHEMIKRMDWEPKGCGGVDLWDNGINSIMIEKCYPEGVDLEFLAKEYNKIDFDNDDEDNEKSDDEVFDHEEKKKMPYTPQRTTLKMKRKKKVSVMKIGEIKEGEDGKMYICKQKASGKLYWTQYVQKTYQGVPVKGDGKKTRKCPPKPAKEFKSGTVRKGEDGKLWLAKEMSNGNLRWVRKQK